MEDIRPVPFAPGYFASADGRVLSGHTGEMRALTSFVRGQYLSLSIRVGGKTIAISVHRIICTTFHGPPQEGHVVRHLDGTRTNNAAANLAWGTMKENVADKWRHGTAQIGSRCVTAKLLDEDVPDIKALLSIGVKQTHIAEIYGVKQSAIWSIAAGRTWAHIPGPDMSGRVSRRGANHMSAKLTEEDVIAIRARWAAGERPEKLANEYQVSTWNVQRIVRRETWRHVPDAGQGATCQA